MEPRALIKVPQNEKKTTKIMVPQITNKMYKSSWYNWTETLGNTSIREMMSKMLL